METRRKTSLGSFVVANGINLFRLDNGNIAVEDTNNIIITATTTDNIELVTCEKESNSVNFWQINDKINALASDSCVTLPADVSFTDFYEMEDLESAYVKYVTAGKCGVLFISDTEASMILSHEVGYNNVSFENGCFYAESDGDLYYVLDQDGNVIVEADAKCKKVGGYKLFYTANKIFVAKAEIKLCGIETVEIISNVLLIKATTEKGVYYYNDRLEYLLGPVQNAEIGNIDDKSYYVFEYDSDKIVNVFYIVKAEADVCASISSKDGIDIICYGIDTIIYKVEYFVTDAFGSLRRFFVVNHDGKKSVYTYKLQPAIKDVEDFVMSNGTSAKEEVYILGFKKSLPVQLCHVPFNESKQITSQQLQFMCYGIPVGSKESVKTYVCKQGETIICVSAEGKVIFSAEGESCCIKGWGTSTATSARKASNTKVYLLEQGENILVLNKNGNKI